MRSGSEWDGCVADTKSGFSSLFISFRSRKIQIRNIPPQLRWEVRGLRGQGMSLGHKDLHWEVWGTFKDWLPFGFLHLGLQLVHLFSLFFLTGSNGAVPLHPCSCSSSMQDSIELVEAMQDPPTKSPLIIAWYDLSIVGTTWVLPFSCWDFSLFLLLPAPALGPIDPTSWGTQQLCSSNCLWNRNDQKAAFIDCLYFLGLSWFSWYNGLFLCFPGSGWLASTIWHCRKLWAR